MAEVLDVAAQLANMNRGMLVIRRLIGASPPSPQPGSDLALDDARYATFDLHEHVLTSYMAGQEQLNASDQLLDQGPPMDRAALTLLRSVLECASRTLWMLGPAESDERLSRHFVLVQDNHSNLGTAHTNLTTAAERARNLAASLEAADQEIAADPHKSLWRDSEFSPENFRARTDELMRWDEPKASRPKYEHVGALRYGARLAGLHEEFVIMAWRLCAGLAHGFAWATGVLATERRLPQPKQHLVRVASDQAQLLLYEAARLWLVRAGVRGAAALPGINLH